MEQMTLLLLVDDLLCRQCRQCLGIPVHHSHATIDKSLVVEVDEDFDDTLASFLVHGECRTVPVAAGTQTTKLLEDDASMFVRPVPSVLQELFAGKVMFLDTLFGKFLDDLSLCCD